MSTYREKNLRMARAVPELQSKWATYPIERKYWLDVSATLDGENGLKIPAFIPYNKDPNYPEAPLKQDYAWGAGPRGYGYYHLLTREAYITLNARVRNKQPIRCCCMGADAETAEDFAVASEILYNRSVGSAPNDIIAAKDAINIARGVANTEYNTSQNVQLFMMAF